YVDTDYPRTWVGHRLFSTRPREHRSREALKLSALLVQRRHRMASTRPGQRNVYLGSHRRPFSVFLFHQLRLDIIKHDIVEALPQEESKLSRHRLNYMRQV
ncbi:hypothetical protein H4582DRAFT_1765289, partial [Lactarius indigo]